MNGHAQKQTKRTITSKLKTTELRFRINNLKNTINYYLNQDIEQHSNKPIGTQSRKTFPQSPRERQTLKRKPKENPQHNRKLSSTTTVEKHLL